MPDWPWGYKIWVQFQTQNKAKWLAACGHMSASNQSLPFILRLRLYSSFITLMPVHPHSLISAFVIHSLKSITDKFASKFQYSRCLCKAQVTQSRFKPRFTTTHPDLRQMVKSGCIGMRRDGKKEILASIRCLTMLLRCLHDSSTDPLRLKTAELRFTTVELRMLTMPPRFNTVLVWFKPVALR